MFIQNLGSESYLIEIGKNLTIAVGAWILTNDSSLCLELNEKGGRYSHKNI